MDMQKDIMFSKRNTNIIKGKGWKEKADWLNPYYDWYISIQYAVR